MAPGPHPAFSSDFLAEADVGQPSDSLFGRLLDPFRRTSLAPGGTEVEVDTDGLSSGGGDSADPPGARVEEEISIDFGDGADDDLDGFDSSPGLDGSALGGLDGGANGATGAQGLRTAPPDWLGRPGAGDAPGRAARRQTLPNLGPGMRAAPAPPPPRPLLPRPPSPADSPSGSTASTPTLAKLAGFDAALTRAADSAVDVHRPEAPADPPIPTPHDWMHFKSHGATMDAPEQSIGAPALAISAPAQVGAPAQVVGPAHVGAPAQVISAPAQDGAPVPAYVDGPTPGTPRPAPVVPAAPVTPQAGAGGRPGPKHLDTVNEFASPGSFVKYSEKDLDQVRGGLHREHSITVSRLQEEAQGWKTKYETAATETKNIQGVLDEFEKTMANMIGSAQKDREKHRVAQDKAAQEVKRLSTNIATMEASFQELRVKYDQVRQWSESLAKNEEALKATIASLQADLGLSVERYNKVVSHAEQKLESANTEISTVRKQYEKDLSAARAKLARSEMTATSLQSQLDTKKSENTQLTELCDELLSQLDPK